MGSKGLWIALAVAGGVTAVMLVRAIQGGMGSMDPNAWEGGEGGATAGDDASNFLEDGIQQMNSMVSTWPIGSGPYQGIIESAALAHDVPVDILAWLLWKESRYRPEIINGTTTSRAGALGIAQFMPATAREELGSAQAALDPSIAIPGAARYLRKLYDRLGNWTNALAAYNWGIGNVQRKGLAAAPAETIDYFTVILQRAGGAYV